MSVDTKTEASLTEDNVVSASEVLPGLPGPDDLPDADVVIFDGKCVFCRKSVGWLRAWVAKDQLAFISLHDPWVAENVADLTHEQLMDQVWLVSRSDNSKHGGAEMVRYLSTRTWKLWLAAPLMHFPGSMPLWQWLYQQVAKRRYKIANENGEPCDDDGTCKLHFDK
jgi:predicted DCC family thiol-disulfide oxidoreductase YuxK